MSEVAAVAMTSRARGSLLGLGIGDALGAPVENLTRAEIAARWGPVIDFLVEDVRGTDDSEYAAFHGSLLLRHGDWITPEIVAAAYREQIAPMSSLRGAGFSELGTIEGLRRGWQPPASAAHLHPWSDGLAMRAAIYGVFAPGDPERATRLVTVDGAVSATGEGLWAGVAVAVAVAMTMDGRTVDQAIGAARNAVPPASWTAAAIRAATSIDDPEELLENLVQKRFPWTDLGPEAVGLAYWAAIRNPDDFASCVGSAVELGRDADTTAAIAGAVVGAAVGEQGLPTGWADRVGPLTGRCLGEAVAGVELGELAEQLVAAGAPQRTERP